MLGEHKIKSTKNGVTFIASHKPKFPRLEEKVIFSDETDLGGAPIVRIRTYHRRGEFDYDELSTTYFSIDDMDAICNAYLRWRKGVKR